MRNKNAFIFSIIALVYQIFLLIFIKGILSLIGTLEFFLSNLTIQRDFLIFLNFILFFLIFICIICIISFPIKGLSYLSAILCLIFGFFNWFLLAAGLSIFKKKETILNEENKKEEVFNQKIAE